MLIVGNVGGPHGCCRNMQRRYNGRVESKGVSRNAFIRDRSTSAIRGAGKENMTTESKCPVLNGAHRHTAAGVLSNRDWWPNQLNLQILHQHSALSNPMGEEFDYAKEFKKVDLNALKKDI